MKGDSSWNIYTSFINKKYNNRPKEFYKDMINAIVNDYREKRSCNYFNKIINDIFITVAEKSILFELYSYYCKRVSHYYQNLPYFPVLINDNLFVNYSIDDAFLKKNMQDLDRFLVMEIDKLLLRKSAFRQIEDYKFHDFEISLPSDKASADEKKTVVSDEEAQMILQKARTDSDRIINDAEQKAKKIVNDAIFEAEQIVSEAKQQAVVFEKTLHEDAESIIKKTINDYQTQIQNAWLKDIEDQSRSCEQYPTINAAKEQYCSDTNELKHEICDRMKKTIDEVRELKNEMEEIINKRQVTIFHHEFVKLADSFGALYRVVSKNPFLTDYVLTHNSEGLPEKTLEDLKMLKSALQVVLKKFERALESFGMFAFYPNEGDPYDDVMHDLIPSEKEYDPYDMVVKECFTPGIMRRGDSADEYEPIIRAEVELKPRGEE